MAEFQGTEQVYTLVNNVTEQAFGATALKVVDAASLVALGNTVLSSTSNTECYMNTLAQRIGKTILSGRAYKNKLADMVLSNMEYGIIVQKIEVYMPEAEADESYDLVDGPGVDMYKISKPKAAQKFFVKRTPYQMHITIQKVRLKEAFLSPDKMEGFIALVFMKVRNMLEATLENLARTCQNNFALETTHEIKLVTEYNAASGDTLTAADAMLDNAFLRWAIGRMKTVMKEMTDLGTNWTDGDVDKFTPFELQRIRVLSRFQTALETNVQYAAFNEEYVKLTGFKELNFWQSSKEPMRILAKRASDSVETALNNVVAMIYDRDAAGIYQMEEDIATTPLNAAALYYNTYWHERQLWFNDLNENFAVFTLN